jgi:type IV pilus assembly protein PilY1
MSAAQKAHFDNKCALLPQCPSLNPAQKTAANNGDILIKWLRGQTGNETAPNALYRDREHVLGDVVNAKPAFVGEPNLLYGDAVIPDYASFKTANASRQSVLYIPANDGMLHAFNADTGAEMWAWVPRMIWPEMYKLASTTYDNSHRYYVDGSPTVMDVFFDSINQWKTILVGGFNAGGRGYYAIDITNPTSPKGLWEVCADPTGTLQCTDKDDNIGFTYGQPIITKDPKDNKWVVIVSSGYNNVSPGDGKGHIFLIDVETGNIKDKKDTGVGDTTTPSGFAKISGFATNFMVNNTTTEVYGGDLLGNVFSFDV